MTKISAPGGSVVSISQSGTTLSYRGGTSGTIDMTSRLQLPVRIINTDISLGMLIIRFTSSIKITNATSGFYFIIESECITIDGGNGNDDHIVIFDSVQNYLGLVQNYDIKTGISYSNITVQNITTYDTSAPPTSTLASYGGWICQNQFAGGRSLPDGKGHFCNNIKVTNCTNNCNVNSDSGGGIVGQIFCINASNSTIQNCINSGEVSGRYAGGIAGAACFELENGVTENNIIESCINNGTVTGSYAGGIVGSYFARTNSNTLPSSIIQGCINNGEVSGQYSGGIAGYSSYGSISNCYTLYSLISSSTTVTISNCYIANGTNPTAPGNGSWSSTDAQSSLTLSDGKTRPTYYWLYTSTTVNTTPFLIASFYPKKRNYVTSTTQFTTTSTSLQTPAVTTPLKYKSKTNTIGISYAGTKRIDVNAENAFIGDKVLITDLKTGSSELGIIRAFGSIYLNEPLKNSYSAGSQIYIYPSYVSDADIYAEQNLPIPIADICFLRNTPIETDQGIIAIQKIDPSVHTINNKKIITITKSVTEDKFLICFEKHALGENIPSARTIVSKYHKIQNRKGKMMDAYKFLEYYEDVKKISYNGEILYNILMEDHETVNVNNLVCETLHPDHEIAKLYKNNYSDEYTNTVVIFMNYSKKVSKQLL